MEYQQAAAYHKVTGCPPRACPMPLLPDKTTICDDGRERMVRCEATDYDDDDNNNNSNNNNDGDGCRWRVLDECEGSPVLTTSVDRIERLRTHRRPLIAVVVGGQLARFELESKLRYLLGRDARSSVDIVLLVIVSSAAPTFSDAKLHRLGAPSLFNGTVDALFAQLESSIEWPIALYSYDQAVARATRFWQHIGDRMRPSSTTRRRASPRSSTCSSGSWAARSTACCGCATTRFCSLASILPHVCVSSTPPTPT
jgi:hypothetical protein